MQTKPFPKQQILDSSKLKQFADNFRFDENGRKLSNRKKTQWGKGEIACYKQFLLSPLPPVFSKDLYCRQAITRTCLGKD